MDRACFERVKLNRLDSASHVLKDAVYIMYSIPNPMLIPMISGKWIIQCDSDGSSPHRHHAFIQPLHSVHFIEMTLSRPFIIKEKRALLPPRMINGGIKSKSNSTYKQLNPSAVAAETCMKAPNSPTLEDEPVTNEGGEIDGVSNRLTRIEFNFSAAPQPFLDPPTWEAMLKRSRTRSSVRENHTRDSGNSENVDVPHETPHDQRVRQEREAEYRSMAIRGRSSLTGRGRRGREAGRGGFWGGRN